MKTFPKPLTASEEREYLKRCKEGDEEAKAVLIERNLRLVAHVIKKYQYTDYEMEDLLSVGTIGLIKAVNTFKMDRGSRLATYAAKCVEKHSKDVSLYDPIGVDKDGETVNLIDVIEADDKAALETIILEQDVSELYDAYRKCLKNTEQEVLSMRYGLFGEQERTQREIAGKMGISRSYVSRIEKKALLNVGDDLRLSANRFLQNMQKAGCRTGRLEKDSINSIIYRNISDCIINILRI